MYDITLIPTELWQHITEYACTDGGRTGRSLALSSKFLNTQTHGSRFNSLAFNTVSQVESFLHFTSGQLGTSHLPSPSTSESEEKWRPWVKHLWLSLVNESYAPEHARGTFPFNTSRGKYGSRSWAEHTTDRWNARYLSATSALLKLIAPTLRTLVVYESAPRPPALQLFLPSLEELTLLGSPIDFIVDASWQVRPVFTMFSPQTSHLPSLRRLHFIDERPDAHIALLADSRLSTFPLVHLRLSGLDNIADLLGVVDHFKRALGPRGLKAVGERPSHNAHNAPFSSLRSVVLDVNSRTTLSRMSLVGQAMNDREERVAHMLEGVEGLPVVLASDKLLSVPWEVEVWDDWVGQRPRAWLAY